MEEVETREHVEQQFKIAGNQKLPPNHLRARYQSKKLSVNVELDNPYDEAFNELSKIKQISVSRKGKIQKQQESSLRRRKIIGRIKYDYKIKGTKIVIKKPEIEREICRKPILFQSTFEIDLSINKNQSFDESSESKKSIPKKAAKCESDSPLKGSVSVAVSDAEVATGVLRYKLSDRSFIEKGWTMLPMEKIMRKKNVYRMYPAHPEFDWFENNKKKGFLKYDTGDKLAEIDENGRGRWYYRNGRLALDYYDSEEANSHQRVVVYSSGEPDERGRVHPVTVLAMFDYLGDGVVFDHVGKIRLKYNQSDGVVLDRGIGPVSHWKWHSLNDPPVLQRVMIDSYMEHKDVEIVRQDDSRTKTPSHDSDQMLLIEFNNRIKEQARKQTQQFHPYQIKMKALKINEQFSLKIIDQASVYLLFRDRSTNLKLNLGMVLDNEQIISTEIEEIGEVANSLDVNPDRSHKTESILKLQHSLENARHFYQTCRNRELKIRPQLPIPSVDRLAAAISRPLYPLRNVQSLPSNNITNDRGCLRKSPQANLFYDTRLI